MPVNDTIYKIELKKLQSFEKSLRQYQSYKIPDTNDFYKMWKNYTSLFAFDKDFSSKTYRRLYKQYGNPNRSMYAERLRMYLEYSYKVSCFFIRNSITVEHYTILVNKFQSLQNELKAVLLEQLGESNYKIFYQTHRIYLENT